MKARILFGFLAVLLTPPYATQSLAQPQAGLNIQLYAGLSVTGQVGRMYQVQYATKLSETNTWYALQHFELKWNPHEFVDTTCPVTEKRFYRAVEVAVPTNVVPVGNMVFIPPGTFIMGSPTNEAGRLAYEAQHQVTISRGFWIGCYETTQAEFLEVMGYNPSHFRNGTAGVTNELLHPVEQVSWVAATNYCHLHTTRERAAGRLPEVYVYRLPTESEWEYACRAGTTTSHHYGDELRSAMANFHGVWEYNAVTGTIGNPQGIFLGRTREVGSYEPNAWGLYDMHGNVWERCYDWYGECPAGPVTDPSGPETGSHRVIRGGHWKTEGKFCRSAERALNFAGREVFGFRVVLGHPYPLQ